MKKEPDDLSGFISAGNPCLCLLIYSETDYSYGAIGKFFLRIKDLTSFCVSSIFAIASEAISALSSLEALKVDSDC